MRSNLNFWNIISWISGIVVFVIGVLNIFLVHPVPGVVYLALSFVFFPVSDNFLRRKSGASIPLIVKITLGIIIIMFTLGVSDLGDMIDDRIAGNSEKVEVLPVPSDNPEKN